MCPCQLGWTSTSLSKIHISARACGSVHTCISSSVGLKPFPRSSCPCLSDWVDSPFQGPYHPYMRPWQEIWLCFWFQLLPSGLSTGQGKHLTTPALTVLCKVPSLTQRNTDSLLQQHLFIRPLCCWALLIPQSWAEVHHSWTGFRHHTSPYR